MLKRVLSLLLVTGTWCCTGTDPTVPSETPLDTVAIEQTFGLLGSTTDGVFKVTKPRSDLHVTMDGFAITPRMGLTAWMAFRPHERGATLMGDIPVLGDELQPVVTALMDGGVKVSALHNHFVGEEPRVMFLHVGGEGDPLALARGLRGALDAIKHVRSGAGTSSPAPPVYSDLDIPRLNSVLKTAGDLRAGVFKVTFPRPSVRLTAMGVEINATMGFNSWMAFQGTNERAAVAGDFALLAEEVNSVVRELSQAGIQVVALHNHMLREQPRLFFMHFWGVGPAEDLARGLRSALDQMSATSS